MTISGVSKEHDMPSLSELEDLLRRGDLLERIVRNLGSSTVVLFAIDYADGKECLQFAGTGTLPVTGRKHGILTAAHVWEDVLKSGAKVGITRTEKITHRYAIDVRMIVPTLMRTAGEWDDRGPDLAFLRIPDEFVTEIEASQVFEYLQKPPKKLGVDALECWVPMGTPEEFGTFTQTHASVEINGSLVNPRYVSGVQDYYDFEVDTKGAGIPNSYGGFSGGGLWRVLVYSSPTTGKVDWAQRLKGVMFWQFPEVHGRRIIRCHGPESIASLVKLSEGGGGKARTTRGDCGSACSK